MAEDAAVGTKRKFVSHEEAMAKVRKTITWYNHNGGLVKPIIYKDVREVIEAVDPRQSLKILAQLEEKGPEIKNPTAWLKSQATWAGPALDPRIKKTISWYNKNGGLQEEIRFDDVKDKLKWMEPSAALKLLQGLKGKEAEIKNPTAWLCNGAKIATQHAMENQAAAAMNQMYEPPQVQQWTGQPQVVPAKWTMPAQAQWAAPAQSPMFSGGGGSAHGLDKKVGKTIGWYNKFGGLQGEIRWADVAPALAQVGTAGALQILKGLDGKAAEIRNPTSWICAAAQKMQMGAFKSA